MPNMIEKLILIAALFVAARFAASLIVDALRRNDAQAQIERVLSFSREMNTWRPYREGL